MRAAAGTDFFISESCPVHRSPRITLPTFCAPCYSRSKECVAFVDTPQGRLQHRASMRRSPVVCTVLFALGLCVNEIVSVEAIPNHDA